MEPMPEGNRALVDQAVEEAAQSLFTAADVPLARSDEILAAIQGPAIRAVLEKRIEQIIKHGHTADGDFMMPLPRLGKEARDRLMMAGDCLYGEKRNLVVARRRAAIAGALVLAFIDRIDAEIAIQPTTPEPGQ